MSFDYKAAGLRIKMIRLRKELTQEKIAEITGLSCPHISNVETGSTKVGLQSLVKIANALEASIDEILYDNMTYTQHIVEGEMRKVISDCTSGEIRVIVDTIITLKQSIRRNFN